MKFSIIIPAYKRTYLKECIGSILAQTYTDFELIIVNDASPEDLDSIVNSFSDSRIRYYKNEKNCGAIDVVDNWNICLSYTKGDWVICMGDDDMLAPNALQLYHEMIVKYPKVDLFHSRVLQIDEEGNPISIAHDRAEWESVYSFMRHRLDGNIQFIGDFCYRTKVLRKNGGFYKLDLAWGSDDISAYIAAERNGVVHINEPTFLYRVNGQTISKTGDTLVKLNAIEQEYQWYCDFIDSHKLHNLVDILTLNCIKNKLNNFYIKKQGRTIALGCGLRIRKLCVDVCIKYRKYRFSKEVYFYAFMECLKRKRT